jgi:hypothetical protein
MMTPFIPIILGSAAVGALVSSLITFFGQMIERTARQKELLLSKSIELAELQVKLLQDASSATGQTVGIQPYIFYARWYQRELESLLSTSKLSSELEAQYMKDMENKK